MIPTVDRYRVALSEIKSHHQWLPLLLPNTAPAAALLGYCPFAFFVFFIF